MNGMHRGNLYLYLWSSLSKFFCSKHLYQSEYYPQKTLRFLYSVQKTSQDISFSSSIWSCCTCINPHKQHSLHQKAKSLQRLRNLFPSWMRLVTFVTISIAWLRLSDFAQRASCKIQIEQDLAAKTLFSLPNLTHKHSHNIPTWCSGSVVLGCPHYSVGEAWWILCISPAGVQ